MLIDYWGIMLQSHLLYDFVCLLAPDNFVSKLICLLTEAATVVSGWQSCHITKQRQTRNGVGTKVSKNSKLQSASGRSW